MTHPAFTLLRSTPISALNITLHAYEHQKTGALHYHLASDNTENVFLVALRTVPMDHKGVAHILEHTALCGSERFPVRDPFFMMTRRSLNTFMNAFTSNDWTAYPFASQNRKDFNNLLDVYLDAVFFSRLDELDFMQEGHRLEFSEVGNKASELVYKGVVFNEMKGAMSSVPSTLWHTLCKYVFPSTTYHYNSGGDPEYITDLSYQELKDFYQHHYHPSNAIFITYGDIPVTEHQTAFEDKVLSQFERGDTNITIGLEKRIHAPIRVQESYAFDGEELKQQTHIVLAWLLGQSTNLDDVLEAQLLSYILLENSACPLLNFLETSDLGNAPSPLTGLEDSYRELVFCCGLGGSEADNADELEKQILAVIEKTANEGISQQRLNAILHQIELSHREVRGDGFPYGLQLILGALSSATHRNDPVELLDLEPALAKLREKAEQPGFVKTILERWLLNNDHRVRLVMTPDATLSEKRQQAEKAQLAAIKAGLSDEQAEEIIQKAAALEQRQAQIDDDSILPKVTLVDVPADIPHIQGECKEQNGIEHHVYAQGTNGLAYQQIIMPVPALADHLIPYLPFYGQILNELGIGDKSFEDVQHWQSESVGSIAALQSFRANYKDEQDLEGYMVFSAKSLARKQEEMADLLQQLINNVRFDEHDRIADIIRQLAQRSEQSVTGRGHIFAMTTAKQGLSPLAKLNETWSGLTAVERLREWQKRCDDKEFLADLAQKLETIHAAVLTMPIKILSIAEQEQLPAIEATAAQLWQEQKPENFTFAAEPTRQHTQLAWLSNSQVNFCAKAYASVPSGHEDSAALQVLAALLRNGFLHSAIREKGGAYGGGASQDNTNAVFQFYSYRDPRISGTLNDFDAAIDWVINSELTETQLEEAILSIISSGDKPGSPAGEAKQAFHNDLFGYTYELRKAYRERILNVTLEDVKRVADTYLKQAEAHSIAVVSHEGMREEIEALGLEVKRL